MTFPPSNVQFYKRILPSSCIAFSSEDGKKIFTEALLSGYANVYFPLAEQFRTQNEPAYCGLSTLVMVLNALAVDPKQVWKGPWRWYHEEMLECCLSLDVVQQQGITLEQFVCLATCNSLDLNVIRMGDSETVEEFRDVIKKICAGSGKVLVSSYSRKLLGQTGDGHFSPIGAYHPEKDMVLIFDVARFKYPPHWVTVDMIWQAMNAVDATTGLSRGYIVMRKTEETPLLLFRLSNIFRVTIASQNLLQSHMTKFVKSWREFLALNNDCKLVCNNLETAVTYALSSLNEALGMILESDSVFTTQFNTCCMDVLPKQHVQGVQVLLKSIEQTKIFQVTNKWITEFKKNNQSLMSNPEYLKAGLLPCSSERCCRIDRVGLTIAEIPETIPVKIAEKSNCNADNNSCSNGSCDHTDSNLVTDSHYIAMFLLSWPYQAEKFSTYVTCLSTYVNEALSTSEDILLNESKQLRHQIQSLVMMVKSHDV